MKAYLLLKYHSYTTAVYPQGMSPFYPLVGILGGPQSRSGRGGDEKKFPSMRPCHYRGK